MNTGRELTFRLAELLKSEHSAMADFVAVLADFDERRLWEQLGYTSLFWFLHRELGISKSAAFYRKTAAELVQGHPEVIEHLRSGELCLTSIAELAKVLTRENKAEVLPRFFTLSAREAKEVTAALLPAEAPPLRDLVTVVQPPAPMLRGPRPTESATVTELAPSSGSAPNLGGANPGVPGVASAPALAAPPAHATGFDVEPLTADLRRLHITVSKRLLDKIDAARDALRQARGARSGRYVPDQVRRAIWERDEGRCQWTMEDGGVCGSTHQVELDHVTSYAMRGRITSAEDGRLLCRPHNDRHAREVFGDAWMDKFTRRPAFTPPPR